MGKLGTATTSIASAMPIRDWIRFRLMFLIPRFRAKDTSFVEAERITLSRLPFTKPLVPLVHFFLRVRSTFKINECGSAAALHFNFTYSQRANASLGWQSTS